MRRLAKRLLSIVLIAMLLAPSLSLASQLDTKTIIVSVTVVPCNHNGICEDAAFETNEECPSDCAPPIAPYVGAIAPAAIAPTRTPAQARVSTTLPQVAPESKGAVVVPAAVKRAKPPVAAVTSTFRRTVTAPAREKEKADETAPPTQEPSSTTVSELARPEVARKAETRAISQVAHLSVCTIFDYSRLPVIAAEKIAKQTVLIVQKVARAVQMELRYYISILRTLWQKAALKIKLLFMKR